MYLDGVRKAMVGPLAVMPASAARSGAAQRNRDSSTLVATPNRRQE
jgi:hypothetical protein